MSLHRKHFVPLADLLVEIETTEFATVQDLKTFIKVEVKRFCYDHGNNFNGHTFESYITNHKQKAFKEKMETYNGQSYSSRQYELKMIGQE